MDILDMDTMDIMARGLLLLSQLLPLSQLLLLSLDMDMVMVMAMDMSAMAMVDMVIMDIMAKGPLMPDMAMVDMDMVMVMDMAMDTVMDMDIMVKQEPKVVNIF